MPSPAGVEPATAPGRPPLVDGASLAIVVLAAMQPFVAFLAGNAAKVSKLHEVVIAAALWTVAMVGVFVAVRLLTRDRTPLAIALAFLAVHLSFWNFSRWLPFEPESNVRRWIAIAVWLLVTAGLAVVAVRLARWRNARTFVLVFAVLWTAMSGITIVQIVQETQGGDEPVLAWDLPTGEFVHRPNVYFLMLDEHARADQLEQITGVDTSWFADDLATRGFSVSATSQSSYLMTHLSLVSTFGMEHAWLPGADYRREFPQATRIITEGANPVVETFRANGYRYVYAPDGSVEYVSCPDPSADVTCLDSINPRIGLREPFTPLVKSTPIGSLALPHTHNDVESVLDGLDDLDLPDDQPVFLFAHILSPHSPSRYEADCTERDEFVEGLRWSGAERARAYATDAACLDADVVEGVDRILATDPTAVIIIQSDHGSRLTFDWSTSFEDSTPRNLRERFGVVNAMRLPADCAGDSIEGLPLVNTYRLLFACLTDTEPDLLEARQYFGEFSDVSTLVEVPPERFDEP